ncbi:uncharacterized protein LOC106142922 isoform X1 [Amyelois transitella]|uniref:uncharacterized protein LOC106142922 isoform X1 n=3 Tax=Amyelois transitella TaxID=680683 RepID=UPI0029901AA8|nr:uncharacterized protein LOC106142922 isoform X1 [Amyelois transitella]
MSFVYVTIIYYIKQKFFVLHHARHTYKCTYFRYQKNKKDFITIELGNLSNYCMTLINRITMLSTRLSVALMMARLASTSRRFPDLRRSILLLEKPAFICARSASDKSRKDIMVDPKHVLSYEDMLKVINRPEKLIIDVRNPDEVNNTGKIPSSINIPLSSMQDVLTTMSNDEFQRQYKRRKPSASDELIFYCQSGRRSSEALDKALKLGYTKSKTYLGSWNDWSSKHQ